MTDIKKYGIRETDRAKIIECLKQLEGVKRTLQELEIKLREQANEIKIEQ